MISVTLHNKKINFNNIPKHQLSTLLCYYWDNDLIQSNLSIETSYGEITDISYTLTHDGYDNYGSKSYIYDIYVTLDSNEIDNWHREDWFNPNDYLVPYEYISYNY